ncbi:hypothetical protein H8B15_08690 [Hymenobacter sp. BT507]|uniref:Nuclear transport factor 2 family protein n=1 Tax=Hymenobacter citatus TaxID=2763506 RepID=A0ABR7MJ73_9BACT|nr:hypothetical protein [Hymenobacter citatus]MBC6610998.1 hypothetical protein [Hymenobacter citatus]
MSASLDTVKQFLQLAESCVTDHAAYVPVLHPEVEEIEFPNLHNKQSVRRNFSGIIDGIREGRELLNRQELAGWNFVTSNDNTVVAEIRWRGEMSIRNERVVPGQILTGHLCRVFELKEGLIFRLRDYYCYEMF